MQRSLTVLLPVHNAQSTLAATVLEILEVASDLTGRLELIILDDGSSDATSEVAHELMHCYPQVYALCRAQPQGLDALIDVGLAKSTGELVFLRDAGGAPPAEGIRTLWHCLDESRSVAVPAERALTRSGQVSLHSGHQPGYRLVQRRAVEGGYSSRPAGPNYLLRQKDRLRYE